MSIAIKGMLGIAGPSLKQGAAGTAYFEPGGVSFWDGPFRVPSSFAGMG
jgi:hypothetical protein